MQRYGSTTCCGAVEIGSIVDMYKGSIAENVKQAMKFLSDNEPSGKLSTYYSVRRDLTAALIEAGWEKVKEFVNPNTKNTVEVLVWVINKNYEPKKEEPKKVEKVATESPFEAPARRRSARVAHP